MYKTRFFSIFHTTCFNPCDYDWDEHLLSVKQINTSVSIPYTIPEVQSTLSITYDIHPDGSIDVSEALNTSDPFP
jgi:hypothetical protein